MKMQSTRLPDKIVKPFIRWNCFIVWSKDKNRLWQISRYFNHCNHFSMFKPMWATNMLRPDSYGRSSVGQPHHNPRRKLAEWYKGLRRTQQMMPTTRYNQIPSLHRRFKFLNMRLGRVELNDGSPFF
jgi:hypothetical protein